jgi:hypothetical protein
MKILRLISLIIIASVLSSYTQISNSSTLTTNLTDCDELIEAVESRAYHYSSIPSYTLYDSSWLKSVEAYEYDGNLFIIAEIKRDSYGFSAEKYIFCGISKSNWGAFKSGLYDSNKTIGERFHKYIIDYTCNCN